MPLAVCWRLNANPFGWSSMQMFPFIVISKQKLIQITISQLDLTMHHTHTRMQRKSKNETWKIPKTRFIWRQLRNSQPRKLSANVNKCAQRDLITLLHEKRPAAVVAATSPCHIIWTDKPRRQTGTQPRLVTCAQPLFMLPVQRKKERKKAKKNVWLKELIGYYFKFHPAVPPPQAGTTWTRGAPSKILFLKCKEHSEWKTGADRKWETQWWKKKKCKYLTVWKNRSGSLGGSRDAKWRHFFSRASHQ